jgi:TolA-binding protein
VAEIALHDLHQRGEVKGLLQRADAGLRKAGGAAWTIRLHRLSGDWHARGRDQEGARSAYERARAALGKRGTTVEENTWRGAFSRSTESFLRDKELDRARDELRRW